MKVILAGFCKTGTKTMADAFTILGYNTYDYLENYYYLYNDWMKVFKSEASDDDIRKMLEGVDAITDAPAYLYWEELAEAFPDAKIVLTIRDEDEWYESLVGVIQAGNRSWLGWIINAINPDTFLRRHYTRFQGQFFGVLSPTGNYQLHHEKLLRAFYNQHNKYVQEKAPKERLLVFKMSEGWAPLCNFLGVDVPDQPFPHKNKKGGIVQEKKKTSPILRKMMRNGAIAMSIWLLVTGYAGYRVYKSSLLPKAVWLTAKYATGAIETLLRTSKK